MKLIGGPQDGKDIPYDGPRIVTVAKISVPSLLGFKYDGKTAYEVSDYQVDGRDGLTATYVGPTPVGSEVDRGELSGPAGTVVDVFGNIYGA